MDLARFERKRAAVSPAGWGGAAPYAVGLALGGLCRGLVVWRGRRVPA